MSEQGKVKWFQNGYGRVSRPDGSEAFLPPRTFARGEDIIGGDELEFDVEPDPDPARPGKFLAKNVKIINKVSRPTPSPIPIPAPAASPLAKEEPEAKVSWRFDPPKVQEGLMLVRTFIAFKFNNDPVPGIDVSLFKVDSQAEETQVLTPTKKATTNEEGEVYFALYLEPSIAACDLFAKVEGKKYPFFWSKPITASGADASNVYDLELTSKPVRPDGKFMVRAITRKNGVAQSDSFHFCPTWECKVTPILGHMVEITEVFVRGAYTRVTGQQINLNTPDGQLVIQADQTGPAEMRIQWPEPCLEMHTSNDGVAEFLVEFEGDNMPIEGRYHDKIVSLNLERSIDDGKNWTIEVHNPPRDLDPITGMFFISVITRKDGKQADCKFVTISEPVPVEIKQMTAAGPVAVIDLASKSPGIYQLYVEFTGLYAKVTFQLNDGTEAVVHLRK